MKLPYIRIATNYYKVAEKPSVFGATSIVRIPWNFDTIKRDHGVEYEKKIPRYDGTVCFPEHLDFKKEIGNFYNVYNPLTHSPQDGSIENSMKFLKHIFGEQLDIGLDFLKLLYMCPLNMLPILCLVSTERNTGKTTFLKWLKLIYQKNATYLTNSSFTSQFNDDWVNCLLVMLDEVLFNMQEYTERLKNLSTTNSFKEEAKSKGRFEVDFFAKFIICSNNETGFIHIDPEETRFWVRKINPLPSIDVDVKLEGKLNEEIPAFLNFLIDREFVTQCKTRMWFTPEQIFTSALARLKDACHPKLEKNMAYVVIDAMDFLEEDSISLLPRDFVNLLSTMKKRTDPNEVRDILKKKWNLSPVPTTRMYTRVILYADGTYFAKPQEKGKYYTITRDFLIQRFDDLKI
ncbi:MAG: hypothetical protein RL308_2608 [Bacteroidota bacterium]|jgi:hypothetical protein